MLPKFPAQAAGPSEIRTYILQVLMTQDGTTSEVANEIANLWRVGRGSELRDASVQLFKEIFGSYTGWFLYRIVHEEILADWKRSTVGIISFRKYPCSLPSVILITKCFKCVIDALIIAIVISIFVVLRRLVPYIFKGSVPESSEKGKLVQPLICF